MRPGRGISDFGQYRTRERGLKIHNYGGRPMRMVSYSPRAICTTQHVTITLAFKDQWSYDLHGIAKTCFTYK